MTMMAMAFPISAGKTEEWRNFMKELNGPRRKDFESSRRELGIHERTFLQKGPNGDIVVVTLEGKNPMESMKRFGQMNEPFATWFRTQVKSIHGVDLSQQMASMPELVIDSQSR